MRLKFKYRVAYIVTYHISIGGHVQTIWREHNNRLVQMHLKGIASADGALYHEKPINPVVVLRNNADLSVAFAVMKHWLETARHRYSYEDLDIYLAAMWRQALEDMGIAPKWNQHKVALTAKTLIGSKAMKKMKEECR